MSPKDEYIFRGLTKQKKGGSPQKNIKRTTFY